MLSIYYELNEDRYLCGRLDLTVLFDSGHSCIAQNICGSILFLILCCVLSSDIIDYANVSNLKSIKVI